MSDRAPVILVVLIDTGKLCWYLGAIPFNGSPIALLKSPSGDLDAYQGLEIDLQISFLRHRLAGVLQRGCDRLFSIQMKASHFILIADGTYPHAGDEVTERLATHFVEWMINPPITYLLTPKGFTQPTNDQLTVVAGSLPEGIAEVLQTGLPKLTSTISDPARWESISRNSSASH